MRDKYPDFEKKDAVVAAIGMGWVEAARDFKEKRSIPFKLLVDGRKETYRALELRRSAAAALAPRVWMRGTASVLSGNLQGPARQDWRQLGAAAVVATDGRVLLWHRARDAADNAPAETLLQALG